VDALKMTASLPYALLDEGLALGYRLIACLCVVMARATGMMAVTPIFSRLGVTGLLRTSMAVVISLPLLGDAYPRLAGMTGVHLVGLLFKECALGVLLGLALGIPFWAAEMAGEVIDLQRGSTMAQLVEPAGSEQSSVMATLLHVLLLALFFAGGGFLLLLAAFYGTYQWWPVDVAFPLLDPSTPTAVLGILDSIARAGVLMVGPLALVVLCADMVMAYLARMSPRLHVFDLSLPVKNLVFSAMVALYFAQLLPSLQVHVADVGNVLELFRPK
jgi:type III secretion protein T